MYEIMKRYQDIPELRHSFNALAGKTFGLSFEDWYQNGFWRENYLPYSIVFEGNIVANVSVNITDMLWNGTRKHLIQLGTVMTEERFRHQGLIRRIMEEIQGDFAEKADGMYLFANDSVLDFYPKFGFRKSAEYQYSKPVSNTNARTIRQIPMSEKNAWVMLEEAINRSRFSSRFSMTDNSGLYLFYVTKFLQENVYYDEALDTYAIAEIDDTSLLIHSVFARETVDLEDVIQAFGSDITKVTLGFTPQDVSGYTCTERKEEDTTLFVKGSIFADFETERLMFPTLAHA